MKMRDLNVGDKFKTKYGGPYLKINHLGELYGYINCEQKDGTQYHINPNTEVEIVLESWSERSSI